MLYCLLHNTEFLSSTSVMKNFLFLLGVFTGDIPFILSVSRKYYLIQQEKTWSDAQAYCRATHTDLAIIKSNDDMVQLQNEAQRQQFSSSAWIGLYNDVNSWRWSFGNEPLGNVTNWKSGEPNNWHGHEECVVMDSKGWQDKGCTQTFSSVCFDNSKTGTGRYIYISNKMQWAEAQSYCRQHHTDLASASDEEENSVIAGLAGGMGLVWIGLFRDFWKWIDQTNFSTISWMSGKPDNDLLNENCGYLDNHHVVDALCSDLLPFFCYSVSSGKQVLVRVKVRSSQDVNDPAVKAAILEQIKQKLKDGFMAENITVKWREDPGGVVFHQENENKKTVENENGGKCEL